MTNRHDEIAKNFAEEFQRQGWHKTANMGYRQVGVNGPVADGMFIKNGEYIALEVGSLLYGKYERLRPFIALGRFSLLHVAYRGEIQFFDKSWCPEHFKADGY